MAEPLPALLPWLLAGPVAPEDIVGLRVPRAPWGTEPLGVVTRVKYRGGDERLGPETLAWVAMDDGTGEQPWLLTEIAKVDMAKWEQKFAGDWSCKCSGERRRAHQVVCPGCGRARPWR